MKEQDFNNLPELREVCPLQSIRLDGTIFVHYALLAVELKYFHRETADLRSAFLFSLPYRSVLRRMTVHIDGKDFLRAAIVSREEQERAFLLAAEGGNTAAALEEVQPGIYSLQLERLPACTEIAVRIEFYTELEVRADENGEGETARLLYPVAPAGMYAALFPQAEAWDQVPYRFGARLELEGIGEEGIITSPTHSIERSVFPSYSVVTLPRTETGKDFILQIRSRLKPQNMVYVTEAEDGMGGMAYYSAQCPALQIPPKKPKKFVLRLDLSGNLMGVRLERAKETLLAFLSLLPEGQKFSLGTFGAEPEYFEQGESVAGTETLAAARTWLSKRTVQNGMTIGNALSELERLDPEEAAVFCSSGAALGRSYIVRFVRERLRGRAVCFLVADSAVEPATIPLLGEATGIKPVFSCMKDRPRQRAEEALEHLTAPALRDVRVTPATGVFEEVAPEYFSSVAARERIGIFVKYRGSLASSLLMTANGGAVRAELPVSRTVKYASFDLLEFLYGKSRLDRLYRQFEQAPPAAWAELRRQVTDTALTYGLLCDETAFLCEIEREPAQPLPCCMRADVPVLKRRPLSEFAKDLTPVRGRTEKTAVILTAAQCRALLFTVLYAQREDGSFADEGAVLPAERAETTALCVAALCRSGSAYRVNIRRGLEYLAAYLGGGGEPTPVLLFALAKAEHAGEELSAAGRTLTATEKASAARYRAADAELPSCMIRGEVSSAARLLIVRSQ